jgi:multidrug efflux pump
MAAHNVSPGAVRQALSQNNYLSAVGQTKGHLVQLNLTASTDVVSLEGFKKLVIRSQNGSLLRLEDVADVVLGADTYDQDVRLSGKQATFMGVWVLPNANVLDVIGRVRDEMKILKAELPRGLEADVGFDSTEYIDSAVSEVTRTLAETVLIVMLVIFLFLGSLRTVLVPIVAIPVSLIGAVFLVQVMGFSVNLLTLLAIVLSVGLVVDDAIVVVENVERHIRLGLTPVEAALKVRATNSAACMPGSNTSGCEGAGAWAPSAQTARRDDRRASWRMGVSGPPKPVSDKAPNLRPDRQDSRPWAEIVPPRWSPDP